MICNWEEGGEKKESGTDCQTSRNVCGIILLLVSYVCGLRGGVVFSGPSPEGRALVGQVGWLPCLQDEKKERKWKRGRAWERGGGFGKAFSSLSTLSIYRSSAHTPTQSDVHTHRQQSPVDKVRKWHHPQEEKLNNFFLPALCCLCCWEKLEPLGLWVAVRVAEDPEDFKGGGGWVLSIWVCPPQGASSQGIRCLNPPWTSRGFPTHSRQDFCQVQCTQLLFHPSFTKLIVVKPSSLCFCILWLAIVYFFSLSLSLLSWVFRVWGKFCNNHPPTYQRCVIRHASFGGCRGMQGDVQWSEVESLCSSCLSHYVQTAAVCTVYCWCFGWNGLFLHRILNETLIPETCSEALLLWTHFELSHDHVFIVPQWWVSDWDQPDSESWWKEKVPFSYVQSSEMSASL